MSVEKIGRSRERGQKVTRGNGLIEPHLARLRCRMADRLIPPGLREGRVLDIGCGSYPLFLSQTRFAERVGLDRVTETMRQAWAREGVRLVDRDLEFDARLPFPDGHFSVVTMLAVFEHIEVEALVELMSEVWRVLRPGGAYVMTTPAAWTPPILSLLSRLALVSGEEIREHKGAYRHRDIRRALVSAGFEPDHVRLGYFEAFMNSWGVATR